MDSFPDRYGRWAVVAGASEGLGEAFAAALAARGMNVVLVARRGRIVEAIGERLAAEHGVEVRCLELDLSAAGFPGTLKEATQDLELGVLVYNAASVPMGPFLDHDEDAIEAAVDVNVRGPLRLVRTLAPALKERGRGAVVLMSSLSGLQGSPRIAVYAATKAFNTIFAEGLWYELTPHGIDVAACVSGAVPTPGYQERFGREVPGMLSADEAVRQTLDALGKGPRIVPGRINRFAHQLVRRFLPRRAAIRLIAKSTRHLG
ncbi:MAG: SDR family NAD(P)-dependent oxidoreductase [Acidobacteriota bacterium]|nr:SDR family NAD(P)-dependent oxidoreductase [Acidobacteriota bacterium]